MMVYSEDRSTQKDTSSSAVTSSLSLTPWEAAAEEICKIAGGRVGALAREVAEQFYVEVMEATQDYLAENVAFNLASELNALKSGQKQLRDEASHLLNALKNVQRIIADGAVTGFNWQDGDWAERLFASQQDTSAAIAKAVSI